MFDEDPTPTGVRVGGLLPTAATEEQPYSRVDLLRLARRRQRRRWLFAGIGVASVLVALVTYLRPEPTVQDAQPAPSAGYALPVIEPDGTREPPIRVPGLFPIRSQSPTPASPSPSSAVPATTAIAASVTVTRSAVPPLVNLSAAGSLDWVHWGRYNSYSVDRKSGGTNEITDRGGRGGRGRYDDNPARFTWWDGSHEGVERGTSTGVYSCGRGSGFTLAVAAGPRTRTLRLYAGVWRARGQLQVRLESGGPNRLADLENRDTNGIAEFTIRFAAPTSTYLLISWTADRTYTRRCGNVSLQAAALQ